jgi:hypothetical protein
MKNPLAGRVWRGAAIAAPTRPPALAAPRGRIEQQRDNSHESPPHSFAVSAGRVARYRTEPRRLRSPSALDPRFLHLQARKRSGFGGPVGEQFGCVTRQALLQGEWPEALRPSIFR